MLAGADLVMPDKFMIPAAVAELIQSERITLGTGVPTIWQGMLTHLRAEGGDLSTLRFLLSGGSAVPEALMRAYQED